MRVFFWAGDTGSGSTWYRCFLPSMGLRWLDHETAVDHRLAQNWRGCDTVVASRPAAPGTTDMIRQLQDRGIRVVADLDDDYFSMDARHHSQAGIDQWAALRDTLVENLKLVDAVVGASPALVEILREYSDRVVHIPNALPAHHMSTPRDYATPAPVVGWAGSASSAGGLGLIKHALRKLADDPANRVLLVGLDPGERALTGLRNRDNIRTTGFFAQQETYLQAVSEFDVWLAPYEESAFNRAKFPTKVLESNFLGIPLIASAIRPYAEQIVHGVTGFLVRSDHEWRRYVNQLLADPELRAEIGMNARARASRSILQSVNSQWEQVCKPCA